MTDEPLRKPISIPFVNLHVEVVVSIIFDDEETLHNATIIVITIKSMVTLIFGRGTLISRGGLSRWPPSYNNDSGCIGKKGSISLRCVICVPAAFAYIVIIPYSIAH